MQNTVALYFISLRLTRITIKVTPTSAKIAKARLLIPKRAKKMKSTLIPTAKIVLNRMVERVFFPN